MKPKHVTDPAREALAAAIVAKAEAARKVDAARAAVETAQDHWLDLFTKAEAAREGLRDHHHIEERELAEMADAVAGGVALAPSRSLRVRLTAEADAAEEAARLASDARDKLVTILRTFESDLAKAEKRLDEAVGGVFASRVEAMLDEAIALTRQLGEKRHFLASDVLRKFIGINTPLRDRLWTFNNVVNAVEVHPSAAEPEIARWAAAGEALRRDPAAPLPAQQLRVPL